MALNDLEHYMLKVTTFISCHNVPEFHIRVRFVLEPAVFEWQNILRHIHLIIPKSSHYKINGSCKYVSQESRISVPNFETCASNCPKMTLNTTQLKIPYAYLEISSLSSKF